MLETNTLLNDRQFLRMLSEEVKSHITTVRFMVEANTPGSDIDVELQRTLRTIEHTQLLWDIIANPTQLSLGPVHVGSTLFNVSEAMRPLARKRGSTAHISIQHGTHAVDADARVIAGGLACLWQAILDYLPAPQADMHWQVRNTAKGVQVRVVTAGLDLRSVARRSSVMRAGTSRQPFSSVAGPATDLVTAYGLLETLGAQIRQTTSQAGKGLTFTLRASQQLSLV